MNLLVETGLIAEIQCGNNFAYVLNDNNVFLPTEYKVLQSQAEGAFVKCMKLLYNGKIQLYYLTDGFKSLEEMLPTLNPENFMVVISNLLADIIAVKKIGFLSCQNIDISYDHIFVDPFTYKISLVYLPLGKKLYHNIFSFENELRASLISGIKNTASLSSSKTMQFADNLANDMLSLENLYEKTKEIANVNYKRISNTTTKVSQRSKEMKLVAINAPIPFEVAITKNEFILGRKEELVDGVIAFNRKIGRAHCKVVHQTDHYAIIDLQSSNGTYVNRVRLQPGQPCPIKDGDKVRLADSEFKVVIG